MSYPWANHLFYRITGNPPPPPQANAQQSGTTPNTRSDPRSRPASTNSAATKSDPSAVAPAEADARSSRHASSDAAPPWQGIDQLAASAEQRVVGWRTITLRLPASPSDPNLIFSIDSGNGGRPDKRAQLTIDRKTAREVRWEPFSSYNSGRRLRSWIASPIPVKPADRSANSSPPSPLLGERSWFGPASALLSAAFAPRSLVIAPPRANHDPRPSDFVANIPANAAPTQPPAQD